MPAGTPKLVLLSALDVLPELKAPGTEPAPAVPGESGIKADVESADLCIEIGPFSAEPARDGFTDWIGEFVAALHFRVETVRKRQLYWIYLEPKSDVEAEQRMADLRRRGVEDYMMIRRGGLKNAIWLGPFSSQDSVNRRLAELNEQGYQPRGRSPPRNDRSILGRRPARSKARIPARYIRRAAGSGRACRN